MIKEGAKVLKPLIPTRNKNGFSLVELMITVAIIGILALIGIPNYNKFRVKALQSEAKSALANLYVAQKSYYFQRNTYYPSLQVVGFSQLGNVRYNVGFGYIDGTIMDDETGAPLISASTGRGIMDRRFITTKSICSGVGGEGTDTNCNMIVDTPVIQSTAVISEHSYVANAVSYEDSLTAFNSNNISPIVALAQLSLRGIEAMASVSLPCGLRSSWIDSWGINDQKVISSSVFIPNIEDYRYGSSQCPATSPTL